MFQYTFEYKYMHIPQNEHIKLIDLTGGGNFHKRSEYPLSSSF